jgi:parvulin-like peptidyl-prolyl isomerase
MLRRILLTKLVACGMLAGCAGVPGAPADAVAVFDGGWVSPDELAAASKGERAGTLRLAGGAAATTEELARWIAWEKLVAESRRPELERRRDVLLRVRELECGQLVPPLLAELSSAVQVSDEEIDAEIASIRADREARGTRLQIRHLFLRASDELPANVRQQKLTLAQRLLGELRGGASFEALARQYSESSNAPNGGFIPSLRPGMTDPAFERFVFAMKEGEISDVIETAPGYHIVLLEKRIGPEPVNEAGLREQLPEVLRSRKVKESRADLAARLKKAEPHEARWNDDGTVDPRAGDGAILVVGDFVYTADDLKAARAQAGTALQRPDQVRAFLDGLLERELLAAEAVRRFQPSRTELAAQHEQAVEAALVELAVRDQEAALAAAAPRAELERFAAEQPAQLEVAATFRPQVIFLPNGKNVWETFRQAEKMVAELRGGADFAAMARVRSTGPNADLGGDLGLLTTNQMMAYDLEIVQLIVKLEVGAVSDPVYIADTKLSSMVGSMKGGFLIVKLLERREPHTLDLTIDEAEVRKRFWAAHRAEILRQQRDERLLGANFQLRATPTVVPAGGSATGPQG